MRRHRPADPRGATIGRLASVLAVVLAFTLAGCGGAPTDQAGGAGTPGTPGTPVAPSGTAATTPARAPSAAAPVPSAGCGTSTKAAGDNERRTITIRGAERWYLLTTPPKHDGKTPIPLVLDFHGLLEGAEIHAKMSNFGALADQEGFAVAFPHGSGQPVRWDVNPDASQNQDLAFVDAMLDQLGQDLCIDTSRVYATGLSYGAIMTSFLTCARSNRFAAVAPVDGLMVPTPCEQSHKMPILTFHGTDDPILTFNGGTGPGLSSLLGAKDDAAATTTTKPPDLNGPGYPEHAAQWAERNGCKPTPTDTKITEHVIHRVYDCPPDAPVEFFIVLGGGHAWPGSEFSKNAERVLGPTTFDIDATKEAWKFFQRFQLPA